MAHGLTGVKQLSGEVILIELIDYVNENVKSIYTRIGELYELEIKANHDPDTVVPKLTLEPCQATVLNRTARQWILRTLRQMAKAVNNVITLYNDEGLRDITSQDEETPLYILQLPKTLSISETEKVLEDDFKRVNKIFDRLQSYADIYI